MPQEFQVLRCYSCGTFQVHQVKKVLKYNCKVCGEKQSIKKVYGRGTGAECRKHVQKCNMLRCELDMAAEQNVGSAVCADIPPETSDYSERSNIEDNKQSRTSNKWEDFLEKSEEDKDLEKEEEDDYTTSRQQFNQVKKDNTKAARERWKEYKQRKYGSYGRGTGYGKGNQSNQDNYSEEYSSYDAAENVASSGGTSNSAVFNQTHQSRSYSTNDFCPTSSLQQSSGSKSAPYSGSNNYPVFSSSTKGVMRLPTASLSPNPLDNAVTYQNSAINNIPNRDSHKANRQKSSSKSATKDKKCDSSETTGTASRWSMFLGADKTNDSSDDESDEDYENNPSFLNSENFGSNQDHNASFTPEAECEKYFISYNQESKSFESASKNSQHHFNAIEATQIGLEHVEGSQSGQIGNGVRKSKTGSVNHVNYSLDNKQSGGDNMFQVDDDLEGMLDDDW